MILFFCSVVAILCCLRPRRRLCQPPLRWRRGCGTCRRRHCQSAATGCSSHRHLGSGRQPLRRRERRPDRNSRQWESWRAPPPRGPPSRIGAGGNDANLHGLLVTSWMEEKHATSAVPFMVSLQSFCSPCRPSHPRHGGSLRDACRSRRNGVNLGWNHLTRTRRQRPAVSAIAAVAAVTAVAVDQVAACDVGALQQDWYLGNPTVRVDQLSINVAEITTRLDRIAGGGQLR